MAVVLAVAALLVAFTVLLHACGLAVLVRRLLRPGTRLPSGFWPVAWTLVGVAWWLILIHVAGISVWALCYLASGCLPDAESAFYFAGVTYTTVGYGDIVLQEPWRLLGPIEGLTGILMCGLSTGLFFGVASRFVLGRPQSVP